MKFLLHIKTGKILVCFVLVLFLTVNADAGSPHLFRIGTGGQTGVYYPIGKIIAQGITGTQSPGPADQPGENGVPGYIGVAQSTAGSISNVFSLDSGEIEAGLVQADVASWAYHGERMFKEKHPVRQVRAIASLYPEKFQIVTRRDAGIKCFQDLRGKRISIDEIGSGTLSVMRIVLQAHGMTEKDFQPIYLKPVFTSDRMKNNDLQGFVIMAGAPVKAVSQLMPVGVFLVPISQEVGNEIEKQYPYLVPGTIPADVYEDVAAVSTIEVFALLVVNETMDDELAYKITAALWSKRTRDLLKKGHPQGKFITPETALSGISIPLHPGAKRYYHQHSEKFNSLPGQ